MKRTREFYLELKVPEDKILLEENSPYPYQSSAFPFFMYKVNHESIQAITFHEYPRGLILSVKLPSQSVQADETGEIDMTKYLLEALLSEGFEWFHSSEMDTLW
ncbi:hypothetical protein BS614_30925 (plasmid) [Paenibacillus xylanexedens]|uniref:hypothetical protein n=1 Tax=Paenibacillus xylanexedens TaxID=528191 RepID=UPI0009382BD2|nr:hypothetical protein [Paenibacillus xylanexedens]APO48535.1 hypothetical protein BS614_30925 [Paenibacillus xylanexedens]